MDPLDPYASRREDPYATRRSHAERRESSGDDEPDDDAFDDGDEELAPSEPVLELSDDMLDHEQVETRHDFERGMARLPLFTTSMMALLLAVFVWEVAVGALHGRRAIIAAGALERDLVLRGQVWRILTSMHLHADFEHLFGNCLALYIMGLAVEHAFGARRVILIYFVSGICGALLCLAFEEGPTVGASGAIFGLWGAALAFYYRFREKLLMRDVRVFGVLLIWAMWTIATGFLSPQISNFSHLGGLIAGGASALLLATRITALQEAATAGDERPNREI